MVAYLLLFSAVIFICIFLNKISLKAGVPVLLLFIVLGLLMGVRSNFNLSQTKMIGDVCSFALIFIMFYGGFGTRWSSAKPVVREAGILATLGVFMTAALVGLFCHFVLKWAWLESLLMGSVISSTDAASVFSILRTRKMGLKDNLAPLIEMESGSNDPCSNLLTLVMLSLLTGNLSAGSVAWMVFAQFAFGAGLGVLIAKGAMWVLQHTRFPSGFDSMFILAVAILSYALPSAIGGNGYLSAYIVGIILGNTEFRGRKTLVAFFDGVTSLMQIIIFFILGLLADIPSLGKVFLPAVLIFLFLSFVARPLAVSSILLPFRKWKVGHIGLTSFVGLRGAASIVFAIMTITGGALLDNDIFSIVFVMVLISISLQGSLIPWASRAFNMIDESSDVMTTFTDFSENSDVSFGKIKIGHDSPWRERRIVEISIPKEFLLTLILRRGKKIIPNGQTIIEEGDEVIFCSKAYINEIEADLVEHPVSYNSKMIGKRIMDYPSGGGSLVVMIRRKDNNLIPNGQTIIEQGDVLVILNRNS